MTNLHPLLVEAIDRFEFAEQPDIAVRYVDWPEFARFNRHLHELTVQRHHYPIAKSVELDITRFSQARRLLRSSFCAPDSAVVGLKEDEHIDAGVTGELGDFQAAVRDAAAHLATTPHAGLETLGEILRGNDRLRWPRAGTARVLVPSRAITATLDALSKIDDPLGVKWEVCTLTEAKRRGSCAITLLAGSPELHVDWRTPRERRHRLVSWLFSAPMSPHTIAMLWPGSQPFEPHHYEPSTTSGLIDPRIFGSAVEPPPPAPPPVQPTPPPPSVGTFDLRFPAIDFVLPDRNWISFGLDHGPRPVRIEDDSEFSIDIDDRVPVKKLRAGDVLVIVEGAKNFRLRRSLCSEWIDQTSPGFTSEAAHNMVDAYKSALRGRQSDRDLVAKLQRVGLLEPYIHQQLARASDRRTIAPQQLVTFRFIADAVGYQPPDNAWEMITALRNGYRHAGRVINDQLRHAVTTDLSWSDDISRRQIAIIEIKELGVVRLAPILSVNSNIVERSESELGEVIHA